MSGGKGAGTGVVLRDPMLEVGPYKILPRTDGKWIVFDKGKPLGQATVAVADTKDAAVAAAEKIVKESRP